MDLGGRGIVEDLEGVGGGENVIRLYYSEIISIEIKYALKSLLPLGFWFFVLKTYLSAFLKDYKAFLSAQWSKILWSCVLMWA